MLHDNGRSLAYFGIACLVGYAVYLFPSAIAVLGYNETAKLIVGGVAAAVTLTFLFGVRRATAHGHKPAAAFSMAADDTTHAIVTVTTWTVKEIDTAIVIVAVSGFKLLSSAFDYAAIFVRASRNATAQLPELLNKFSDECNWVGAVIMGRHERRCERRNKHEPRVKRGRVDVR